MQFWRSVLRFYQVLAQLSSRSNFIKSSKLEPVMPIYNWHDKAQFSLVSRFSPQASNASGYFAPDRLESLPFNFFAGRTNCKLARQSTKEKRSVRAAHFKKKQKAKFRIKNKTLIENKQNEIQFPSIAFDKNSARAAHFKNKHNETQDWLNQPFLLKGSHYRSSRVGRFKYSTRSTKKS